MENETIQLHQYLHFDEESPTLIEHETKSIQQSNSLENIPQQTKQSTETKEETITFTPGPGVQAIVHGQNEEAKDDDDVGEISDEQILVVRAIASGIDSIRFVAPTVAPFCTWAE